MLPRRLMLPLLCSAVAVTALAGCKSKGDLVINEGVGITAIRTKCPAVGIPDYTGDVTLFSQPGNKTSGNIDVVAAMTNVRSQCNEESGDKVYATVNFDVVARRTNTSGARQVTLPYFVSVLQGGNSVVAKRLGQVTLNFADGAERAQVAGTGTAYVDSAAATLPEDVRERITRRRKAGDPDAALDPLADPEVRSAIQRATFEVLVGFQLDQDSLAYNATR